MSTCLSERWESWPSPVGLTFGLLLTLLGQFVVVLYQYGRHQHPPTARPVQKGGRRYAFREALIAHVTQPGGLLMLLLYLTGTWMFDLLPCSYYASHTGVRPAYVFAQMLVQDLLQFVIHWMEHRAFPQLYKMCHKSHHRFTNPIWADAFNGSIGDTFIMILIPLFVTSHLIHANVWEYMVFGTLWSAWLVLIHSETVHPWDSMFRKLGLGTSADHHVHHKLFVYNYGHIFMWWDRALGTYKKPD